MCAQTANLKVTEVDANQNQKEVTLSSAFENFDGAITDLFTKALSNADYTLTTGEGGEALAHMAFTFTGALTAGRNIIVPTNKKIYIVNNNTTGGFNLTVKTASGTGIAVAPSSSYIVLYCDGTNVVAAGSATAGTVTHTAGALIANQLVIGNGTDDEKVLGSLGTTTTVLHGNASGAPSFSAVVEGDISLSAVTTNDVSTSKHGFCPVLPNDASKFLDGTGNYSVPAGGGGGGGAGSSLFSHFADAGNTGTSETDLYSDSIAGGTLSSNGMAIVARYAGTFVNSTSSKQLKVYFGGTVIFDSGALTVSAAADWDCSVLVVRESSSIVRCSVFVNLTGASTGDFANYQKVTGLTLSSAQTLKITGTAAGAGAATNDIVASEAIGYMIVTAAPNNSKYIIGAADANLANAIVFPALSESPDVPPASPTVFDDEFEGTSLGGIWSWVNQGGATSTISNSWISLTVTGTSGDNKRLLLQTLSGAGSTWEFTCKISGKHNCTNFGVMGMAIRDSGGQIIAYVFGFSSGKQLAVSRYNSPTSFNSANNLFTTDVPGFSDRIIRTVYLRIKNDGTNLKYSLSENGVTYYQFLSESKTAFLADLDKIGLVIDPYSSAEDLWLNCDWFRKTA